MNRHLTILILLAAAVLQGCSSSGREGAVTATCPDAVRFLPDFPPFEDSEAFFNDSLLYVRGKALRETGRGKQAVEDAKISIEFYFERFGQVMGVEISEQNTPAVAAYLNAVCKYTGEGIRNAKDGFQRQRPFHRFGEPTSIPEDEERYGKSSSYPSGHGLMAWMVALSLVSLDEQHQYDILHLGYELGQSRVISGYHYQSDVDAARLAAGAAYARIVSDPQFVRMMERASRELDSKRTRK